MRYQLILFTGGVVNTDTAATPNAMVQRQSDGSVNTTALNATNVNNTGGTTEGVKTLTTSATLDDTTTLVSANAGSGALTVALPAASASTGQRYHIGKNDTSGNAVTIQGSGSDNIIATGVAANTLALSARGNHAILFSDGTQWLAIKA